MSAAKRTRQHKTVWLKPHEITEPPASFRKNVLNYPEAQLAFASVTGARLNEELFWRMLWELACREDEGKPQASRWYSLPGLPLHALRRLPQHVRSWAAEIEGLEHRIRSNQAYRHSAGYLPLFLELQVGKTSASGVPEDLARRILKSRADLPKLTELPRLLRLYADQLEAVCKFTARHAPNAPARFRANLEFAFIEYVKRMTGRPHFPEIATLLTAAYSAHGSSKIVDARNLSMQYSRHSPRKQ